MCVFPRHDWINAFDNKIESVRKIIDYAKLNLNNEENMEEVRRRIKKM